MITEKSLDELSALLEKKEISSGELTRAYLERIEKLNPSINAFVTVNADKALKAAQESDERRKNGSLLSPYDGIPIAVKDNINTKGVRTTCSSRMLENYIPPFDAAAFENISAKGFILIGKTNMDEFAMGSTTETSYFGATKN
ncbi:MAG: amidase family protein, partial [Leptospirales bacterium]|nr:amidase family protein [Leptospirales bacterium]